MPPLRTIAILAAASLAASLGCILTDESTTGVSSGPGGGPDTTAAAVSVVSGDNQTGPFGTALPDPLVVRVTSAAGDSLEGVLVDWTVTEGGGSLSLPSSSTDTAGLAQVSLTLGPGGTNRVRATVRNTTLTADFTATATVTGSVAPTGEAPPHRGPGRGERGP
jgi:hypothetical protein